MYMVIVSRRNSRTSISAQEECLRSYERQKSKVLIDSAKSCLQQGVVFDASGVLAHNRGGLCIRHSCALR